MKVLIKPLFALLIVLLVGTACQPVPTPYAIVERVVQGPPLQTALFVLNRGSDKLDFLAYGDSPDISPDGKKILYSLEDEGLNPRGIKNDEIWVTDLLGNKPVNLTNTISLGEHYPKWSPDGKLISYVARHPYEEDICFMNTDGNQNWCLSDALYLALEPYWDPNEVYGGNCQLPYEPTSIRKIEWLSKPVGTDELKIAFVSTNYGTLGDCKGRGISTLNTLTLHKGILSDLSVLTEASWFYTSPDGTEIMFTRWLDDDNIYKIDVDGSNLIKLIEPSRECLINMPGWSPDGSQILFSNQCHVYIDDKFMKLSVIDSDGTDYKGLTNNSKLEGARWSPDGSIVFKDDGGVGTNYWIWNLRTDTNVPLTRKVAGEHDLDIVFFPK